MGRLQTWQPGQAEMVKTSLLTFAKNLQRHVGLLLIFVASFHLFLYIEIRFYFELRRTSFGKNGTRMTGNFCIITAPLNETFDDWKFFYSEQRSQRLLKFSKFLCNYIFFSTAGGVELETFCIQLKLRCSAVWFENLLSLYYSDLIDIICRPAYWWNIWVLILISRVRIQSAGAQHQWPVFINIRRS